MNLTSVPIKKSLNKAYLRTKENRADLDVFKREMFNLFNDIDINESEEFHKNLIISLLEKTYYDPNHFINTKGRNDLVIHTGKDAKSSVGVIIEVKNPVNKSEMIKTDNINTKAFQELILYYLRERISKNNLEIKHLIVTNINEWFIFDAHFFEKSFAKNSKLVEMFIKFEDGRLGGQKTDFFYKEIARPAIEAISTPISFVHFDIRDYEKTVKKSDTNEDIKLVPLFKVLSPAHLLKLPFTNDSNTLDKSFYAELLHIIGLTERKEDGKKLIGRKVGGDRQLGSIIENTIVQLRSLDKISRLTNPSRFGANEEERLYNVALELAITWINRVIFLKLLEAQLINYHKDKISYALLNTKRLRNFGDLNSLFFQVLATKVDERSDEIKASFNKIPYLNSSLFEPTELEHATLLISNLSDSVQLPLLTSTVLKQSNGKRQTGSLATIDYLFSFLDSYDFGSSLGDQIQEENKSLISSSVLGLIFEKINGYRDGSFFTPGFVTMYMSRETIRRAVIEKFNKVKGWSCENIDDIYDAIEDRTEANEIVNSITICDPAVGSGHFLVSALNEIIAIKSDLRILLDRSGLRLKEYNVEVENDELIVTDEDGDHVQYRPGNKESQRVQESLFHEKQTIIENCLFGVDINPNSVKICRLRLWIELLKNAYYKPNHELETLPNIDINIKTGNSLISRFSLDADLKQTLKKSKMSLSDYKAAVVSYREAKSKSEKKEMESLIQAIKTDFRSEISANDPKIRNLRSLQGELRTLQDQGLLFSPGRKELIATNKKIKSLEASVSKREKEIDEIRSNKIYENAFEWRFEFAEALNDSGDFIGFDVCIGNPPWGAQMSSDALEFVKSANKDIIIRMVDTFMFFINLCIRIKNKDGIVSQIVPDVLLYQLDNEKLREKILDKLQLHVVTNLGDNIFEDVARACCIVIFSENRKSTLTHISEYRKGNSLSLDNAATSIIETSLFKSFPNHIFATRNLEGYALLAKGDGTILSQLVDKDGIQRGVSPDLKEAFVVNDEIISKNNLETNFIERTVTGGRDIEKYLAIPTKQKIIYTKSGIDENEIPGIIKYISSFTAKIKCKEVKDEKHPIWSLHRARDKKIFDKTEKILGVITGDKVNTSLDQNKLYPTDGLYIFSSNEIYSNTFLVGLLNSRLITYFYRLLSMEEGRTLAQIKPSILNLIPVRLDFPITKVNDIEEIVYRIIDSVKENKPISTEDVRCIDKIVYELYSLSAEDINLVEKTYERA